MNLHLTRPLVTIILYFDYLSLNIMDDRDKKINSIDRKLSIVISLLVKIANNGTETTLRDQIRDLSSFGLAPVEIADILGKKGKYINKELSTIRKESRNGK